MHSRRLLNAVFTCKAPVQSENISFNLKSLDTTDPRKKPKYDMANIVATTINKSQPNQGAARSKAHFYKEKFDMSDGAVLKEAAKGHKLVVINKTRLSGRCVNCLKSSPSVERKKELPKIITHCPQCPGGQWMCEPCFDMIHI